MGNERDSREGEQRHSLPATGVLCGGITVAETARVCVIAYHVVM